jgi:hypothetical protein
MKKPSMTIDEAQAVAIRAVEFLARDDDRLGRFLALTGVGPSDIAAGLSEPAFLAGVLDHVMSDESLLFLFCDHAGLAPDVPAFARRRLSGPEDTW